MKKLILHIPHAATKKELIKKGSEQQPGDHRYYFEGSNLDKGIYVVTVVVNNEKKTFTEIPNLQ